MTGAFGHLVYGVFALGGVALYFAMPRPEGTSRWPAAILGTGAIAGLLVLLATQAMSVSPYNALFYLFAGLAVAAGGKVVTHPIPTYSAVYFGLVVLCVAVLLVMRMAEFLAVALVIIYAGAILVTYAFVLMLAQQSGVRQADVRAREPLAVIVISFLVVGALAGQLDKLPLARGQEAVAIARTAAETDAVPRVDGEVRAAEGNTRLVGERLFGKYVVVVQVAGLLLLIAMVGAIAMARKPVPAEDGAPPPPKPGDIGRQVKPF